MVSRGEFIEYLHELIADDPTMIRGSEEEIIYQIDDLTLYGGFEMGLRGVDHRDLRPEGATRENIFEWGTVVVPEARTYISNQSIEQFERMGFQKLPTDSNHLVNYKEEQAEFIEVEYEANELLNSPEKEIQTALFHGSTMSFDHFELQDTPKNGTALGFGIYLTDDQKHAEMYAGEEGYIYTIDPSSLQGNVLSSEEVTLTHDQVFELVVSISEDELSSDDPYPYLLSEVGEPSSETEMTEGNLFLASVLASQILDSANDDLDVINELNNLLGRVVEGSKVVIEALNKQDIHYSIRAHIDDQGKSTKEIVVFDPTIINILQKRTIGEINEKYEQNNSTKEVHESQNKEVSVALFSGTNQKAEKLLLEKPNMFEQRKAAAVEKNRMIEKNLADFPDQRVAIDSPIMK